MNLNKVFLLGRLTGDPQLRSTPSGAQVANFSIATNRVWNDASGSKKEAVEFHNIVVWGKQADVASKYLVKGSLVLIEGRLQTRQWETKEGQKRQTTEIVSERLQLGPKPRGASNSQSAIAEAPTAEAPTAEAPTVEIPTIEVGNDQEIKSEDLPF